MIRRAIERGVSTEHLAKALSVDVSQIIKKMNLLDGICPEAAEMLKDRQFSAEISRVLPQPIRPALHRPVLIVPRARDRFKELGAEKFSQWMKGQPQVLLTDTTMRRPPVAVRHPHA